VGWGAVLVLSVGASAGTLVLVRQAIGDGNLADPLSQAQVRSQYDNVLHPSAGSSARPGTSGTATSANAPTSGPIVGPTSLPPTSPPPAATGGSTSGQHSSGGSTNPHPGGSSPSSTSHTSAPPAPVTKVLTSSGGTVLVRCSGKPGQVYLVSWSPAQGYEVNGVQRGPGEEAEIEFESDRSSVSVHYHCTTNGPVQQIETGDGWSGGGGGDDGGGGSSGDD
jgi:hypothetical protein